MAKPLLLLKAIFDPRFRFDHFFFLEQEVCSNSNFLNRSANHVLIVSLEVSGSIKNNVTWA